MQRVCTQERPQVREAVSCDVRGCVRGRWGGVNSIGRQFVGLILSLRGTALRTPSKGLKKSVQAKKQIPGKNCC